jgi:hypothetical protein
MFPLAQFVLFWSHGLLTWRHLIASQWNRRVNMHPRCVCCWYKLSLGLMTCHRGRCSIFPCSSFFKHQINWLISLVFNSVHQSHYEIMRKGSYFVPATVSTVSWDPLQASWTANLSNYLLNFSITLYTWLPSPWIRVMHSALYQIEITLSRSPCRKLSNGIKFINFQRHLSFVPISIKFCREYLKSAKQIRNRREEGVSASVEPTVSEGEERDSGVIWVDSVRVIRPHMSDLMNLSSCAPSSHRIFLSLKVSSAPSSYSQCFPSPVCTQWSIISKLHPLKSLIES